MDKEILQYGAAGIVAMGMGWFIMYLMKDNRKERKEWREFQEKQMDRMDKQIDRMLEQGEMNNKVIREHSNILSGIKTLIENRNK